MFLAILNNSDPNFDRSEEEAFKTTLISAKLFSTSMVAVTISLKALVIPYTAPADAPNAKTRALEASSDLLNSDTLPLILPNG